jgi:tetratricopeptide (TPR) repeat protein
MQILKFVYLSVMLIGLWSCANRKTGFDHQDMNSILSEQEKNKAMKAAMDGWSKRHVRSELEAAIKSWEKVGRSVGGDNMEIYAHLAHAYYLLGDAHEENTDLKKSYFEKGAMFGEKAMSGNSSFNKALKDQESMEKALIHLDRREVPAMYWTAANLGKWSKASGILEQLKYKSQIKALIERVEKLDAKYFYSAPSRYWGAFYALAPGFAGGDLKKSLKAFNKSLEAAPQYLGTKVLMADTYYMKKNDRESFKKVLEEVIATPDDVDPAIQPENVMEKEKARKLLEKIDQIF